ncbi:MAG: hypothetical protein J7M05_10630 [Anaerolineae bacterium]|nr:hypothetical protein [Anaerolineae bacterium]
MEAAELWQRAKRGGAWLLSHQKADGQWCALDQEALDAYYKAAWTLALLGEPLAAQRVLNHIERSFLLPDGDLGCRKNRWHREVHYPYANAYIVIGGMQLGRYALAQRVLRFLLTLRAPASGAFASVRTEDNVPVRCDTMSTAAAGLACVAAGQLAAACRAADWLGWLVRAQPDPEKRFFCTVDAEGQLVTSFPTEDAPWRVVEALKPGQIWYAVGLPFVFLVKLAQATGKRAYLELAGWFFAFQERCDGPWTGPSSGKAGWGCAELYRMTGKAHYREVALQVGEYMAQFQSASGAFLLPLGTEDEGSRLYTAEDFDLTAEYTLWLAQISVNLQARTD